MLFGTAASEFEYRFNWIAPFFISPHDNDTVYFAGNVVFKSEDEGLNWEQISPDLTHNMTDKMESSRFALAAGVLRSRNLFHDPSYGGIST